MLHAVSYNAQWEHFWKGNKQVHVEVLRWYNFTSCLHIVASHGVESLIPTYRSKNAKNDFHHSKELANGKLISNSQVLKLFRRAESHINSVFCYWKPQSTHNDSYSAMHSLSQSGQKQDKSGLY